jgi:hypothetical protein
LLNGAVPPLIYLTTLVYLTTLGRAVLSELKITFLHDALIRFARALDAILELAFPFRKLRKNLVRTRDSVA